MAGVMGSRPLGASGMAVSALSLGSWRTLERVPAATGVAIMRAAREEGISFFDDARYDGAQQVQANCTAISLLGRLGPADLAHLHRIGLPETPPA